MPSIKYFDEIEHFIYSNKLKSLDLFEKFNTQLSKYCRSSYIENKYGKLFSTLAYNLPIKNIAELGVLDGYSLMSLTYGLTLKNKDKDLAIGLDLFEDYEYKNSYQANVQALINKFKLKDQIKLIKSDIFKDKIIEKNLNNFDLVHIDLSNDAILVEKLLSKFKKSLKPYIILLEGGSKERDEISWMKKFNKKPLNPFYEKEIKNDFNISIINAFPSLTILTYNFNL